MSYSLSLGDVSVSTLPNGVDGVRVTLNTMARMVRLYRKDMNIRRLALNLTRNVASKNTRAEVEAIHAFVSHRIRYVRDINQVETIATPIETLRVAAGDCDDKSVLVASLLEAIGFHTRFVACGFQNGPFSHVFAEVLMGKSWIPVETTVAGAPLGWRPKDATCVMLARV